MLHEFAIADTCFLIDWARYRRRDILFKLFKTVFVPEVVLREVVSENTISWISRWLAKGGLALYTEDPSEIEKARKLVEKSRRIPHIIPVDLPEALCLIIGKRRNYIVLTENRGALMAVDFLEEVNNVTVWRSLEILVKAIEKEILSIDCNDPEKILKEYMNDTLHIFPRRDYNRVVRWMHELCQRRK